MISFFKKSSSDYFIIDHSEKLSSDYIKKISWIFGESKIINNSYLKGKFIGPLKEMTTPWSTNAVEISKNIGINSINRIERFYKNKNKSIDPMLEFEYKDPNQNVFKINKKPEKIIEIKNIKNYNKSEGLALSEEEIIYLENVSKRLKRSLTDSEVFGFSQVNSEHCRHKIFNGDFVIDGIKMKNSLFKMIKETSKKNSVNLISAYKDNVAFIKGPSIEILTTHNKKKPDYYKIKKIKSSISIKAETHNFPTTVEPFSGAATGSGGEIRDRMAGGQASFPLAGTAVYMTSYPRINKSRPWEKKSNK